VNSPLILLTNDDGIRAKGLQALVEIAKAFGTIVVTAPEDGQSAQSHAITSKMPLRLRNVDNYCGGINAYACSGTPTDCIKIAMSEILNKKPDIVLSGINHGGNSSLSVLYSGTVAAAQEGALYGCTAIAFSLLNDSENADFSSCIHAGQKILEKLLHEPLPQNVLLSVNFPNVKEFKGVKITRLANGIWHEHYIKRSDPNGNNYYWLTGHFENNEPNAQDTDEWAIAHNYVSITPIQSDMTCHKAIPMLNNLNLSLV
jgi:5'-nucleotidase